MLDMTNLLVIQYNVYQNYDKNNIIHKNTKYMLHQLCHFHIYFFEVKYIAVTLIFIFERIIRTRFLRFSFSIY